MDESNKIAEPHRTVFCRATGEMVVSMMERLTALPEDMRFGASEYRQFKTVDGHVYSVVMEYAGFEGMDTLPAALKGEPQ